LTAFLLAVAAYFVAVVAVAAWWLAPNLRARASARAAAFVQRGQRGAVVAARRSITQLVPARAQPPRDDTRRTGAAAWMRAHAATLALALTLIGGLPLLSLALRHHLPFDGYDHTVSREVNAQIAALLAGEQLVAPQPLPPALFTTPEVELAVPHAATASREWALLDPDFRQRLLLTMRLMRERHGIEMVLLEGYRSAQRQAELAALGPTVTRAVAGTSYHQVGLAADCAFLFDGRIVINEQDPRAARAYALYGELAQSAGLHWGGAWRNLKDLGHVELRRANAFDARTRIPKES
jgi:peptidoglycan LD-endopeptidase CwlK